MKPSPILLIALLLLGVVAARFALADDTPPTGVDDSKKEYPPAKEGKVELTDEEWKARQAKEEYRIHRQQGTERALTGNQ